MAEVEERDLSRERDRLKRDRPSRFSENSRDRSSERGKDRSGTKSGNSNCRVYISNIPYEYRWQDVKDLFREHVGDVTFVELFLDENDKPRGCGVVEFSDPASVKKSLEVLHRFEIKGRKIVIKEDFGTARDKYGNPVGAGGKRARDRDDNRDHRRDDRRSGFDLPISAINRSVQENIDYKWGNTYGLSASFLESLWIATPLCNRVFVANLDYKVDKKKLKEIFRLAGKVQRVDLSLDKEGNSRGFAIIEYDHPVEAVQAISMFHNQQLYDRTVTVRMDRANDRETLKLPEGLKGIGMGLGENGTPLKDVARNLPMLTSSGQNQGSGSGIGNGILGAVPAQSLQVGISNAAAAALSNLGSSALSGLGANLAGVGNLQNSLLANSLGGGDLGLAAQSLAALNNPGANLANNNSSNIGVFSRSDNSSSFMSNQSNAQQGVTPGSRSLLSSYETQKNPGFNFGGGERDRDRGSSGNLYNPVNTGGQVRSALGNKPGGFSSKVLICNLPPSASYKMLREKCTEFGDVQHLEDKGNGSVLVYFGTEWEAERAIKNMDRARIDGRTIDVRFYF